MQIGAEVTQLDGQLGVTTPISDAVSGLIMNGVSTGEYTLGEVKRLVKLKDAENLGFNAAYDATNTVLVYAMIKEFFRLQPEGILYIMVVTKATTQTQMVSMLWPLMIESESVKERIGCVALKRNPAIVFAPAQVNGIWNEITPAITAWSATRATLEQHGYFPGVLILDGSNMDTDITSLEDLRALNNAEGVAVCIGQDPSVASLNATVANYADTGAMLGLIAQRKASESMGALKLVKPPKKYRGLAVISMTETLTSRWLKAALSNGTLCSDLTDAEVVDINAKGYCYFDRIYNFKGIFGVNGATVIAADSDYAWIERFNLIQKAKHLMYQFFVPYKNKQVELINSKLDPKLVVWLQNEATNEVLGQLRTEGNISDYTKIEGSGVLLPQDYNFVTGEHESDPAQSVTPETLVVRGAFPIKGILRHFEIAVGLTS